MASARPVRDGDTALWLHNKLGSTEELWVSSSIGGIIKTSTIDNIFRCFPVLTTVVKMKLLLGILHLPRRSLEEMKHTIDGLVELALDDVDQWVKLVANIVKTYPMMCKLSLDLSPNEIAANVIHQLKEKVKDSDIFATLPLEYQYLNKNALLNFVGNQPPPRRHFALKRKPKSAALRVDLMQKSTDASSQVKRGSVSGFFGNKTVPVKHRDMTRKLSDASPMRGIPKTPGGSHRPEVFRSPSIPNAHMQSGSVGLNRATSRFFSRSERGTKLLDISEQPVATREVKRRKKQPLEDESTQPVTAEDKEDETPEYAVGLVPSTMKQKPAAADESIDMKDAETSKDDHTVDHTDMDDETQYSSSLPSAGTITSYSIPDNEGGSVAHADHRSSSRGFSAISEQQSAAEDIPSYAMPATPSPFYKPVTSSTPPPATDVGLSSSYVRPTGTLVSPTASNNSSNFLSPADHSSNKTVHTVAEERAPNLLHDSRHRNIPPEAAVPSNKVPSFYATPSQSLQISTDFSKKNTPPQMQNMSAVYARPIYHQQVAGSVSTGMPSAVSQSIQGNLQANQQIQKPSTSATLSGATGIVHLPIYSNVNSKSQSKGVSNALYQQHFQSQWQQQAPSQPHTMKEAFTLTREQMSQAQDIFASANRLSRHEKSIILGFIAGSRDNPYPDKGHILQVVLSENEQSIPTAGRMMPVIVETLFEMNYRTGETCTKRRVKPVSG